jgi:hypothetical protein
LFPNMKSETRRMQDKGVHCYLLHFTTGLWFKI